MKILFAIDTMTAGGKERRLIELMKGLKPEPHICFEIALMSEEIHYEELFELGIKIHFLVRDKKKDISVFFKFYRLCKSLKPDIVHCWDTMTAVYVTPACKTLSIKLVNGMVVDSPDNMNLLDKRLLRARLTFPFADAVVGNSKAGLQTYKAPEKKSFVIYNGFNFIRTNGIIPAEMLKNELNILTRYIVGMVATFSDKKDYPTYFEAAQILMSKRSDITFLAIGKNTDSPEASNLIKEEYRGNFRLLGRKTGIESYVNLMNIGILSTFTEGISNSILEYMALGKPVIATSGGGTNEIIIDGETGFIVSPSSPSEIAERIEQLLDDPELCRSMGESGQTRIKTDFSIEKMIKKYLDLYCYLLQK